MKILILGNSNIFQRKIYYALKKFKSLEIEIASTRKINTNLKINQHYHSYGEAIKKTNAEIVYISLINSKHYSWAIKSLNENKHVIVDKPLTLNFYQTKNIKCFCNGAEKLPFPDNYFNYYTVSFGIRNVKNINSTLKEAYRVLKTGGRFICLEFSKVENEPIKKLYKLYSSIIPEIGKVVVGKSFPYKYLTKSIENFYNQEEFVNKIAEHKFEKITYKNLSFGVVAIHSGWKI